uniref:Globin family profile domain-containing protein n=1 Tax=Acrobeloides nanus TaxID=290746 RepID=A0A914BVH9_9BILA
MSSDSASSLSRMPPSQKQALVTSWRQLKPQAFALMRKILVELEIVAPKVKDIFYKAALVDCFVNKEPRKGATVDEHIRLLIQFFDDLINNIDNEQEAIAMVKRVGQHHAILNQSCGFNANIWEQLGEISMEKICCSDPVQIFYKAALVDCFVNKEPRKGATVDEHIRLLIQFFDDLISNIDNEQEAIAMVKRVGQHHAILNQSCGFNANIWEQLGEISMEKICCSDPVQKTRESGRAWRTLIAFVTDELRCGFDGEARVFSRKSSVDIPDEDEVERDRQNELLIKLQEMRMEYHSTVPL